VSDGRETVFGSDLRGPGLDGGRFDLHRLATPAAEQVVVVAVRLATAVDGLAIGAAEDVDDALIRHGLEDPVRGGQGHRDPGILQRTVEFLRADEVLQTVQSGVHRKALLGHPRLHPGL